MSAAVNLVAASSPLDWSASAGYVIGAWGASALILGGYIWSVLRRGRQLSRDVPSEHRRWM